MSREETGPLRKTDPYAVPERNQPLPSLIGLADDLRELTEQMVRIPSLSEEAEVAVAELRTQIRETTALLEGFAPADAIPRFGPEPAEQRPFFASGVILGPHHPLQPELVVEHEPGRTHGSVRFGITFEGPPGCVHGGFVAHFFDQILGQHNLHEQIPAMTGTLSVRYLKATPLLTDLQFEVRHEPEGERKVVTQGFLAAGAEVFCKGEGVFIVPRSGPPGLAQ